MNNTDYNSGTTLKNDRQTEWPVMLYFPPPTDEQIDELLYNLGILGVPLSNDSWHALRAAVREWLANL